MHEYARHYETYHFFATSDGQVLVLISYPTHLGNSTAGSAQELYTYAVARLAFNGSIAEVQSLTNLTYDMVSVLSKRSPRYMLTSMSRQPRDARPGTAPKMVLLDEGDAVLVQFGAAVVVASLTEGSTSNALDNTPAYHYL